MSIHWARGRFHGWALMSFHQIRWTVPGARMCWLTWGGGALPSRQLSVLGGSGLSQQPHSSLGHRVLFLPDNPEQLGQPEHRVLLHVSVWLPSQELGNPVFEPMLAQGDQDFQSSTATLQVYVLAAISCHGCNKIVYTIAQEACFLQDAVSLFPQWCLLCISSLQETQQSFEHFKPWSGSIWNCTLKKKHIPELETLTIRDLPCHHCSTNAHNCL